MTEPSDMNAEKARAAGWFRELRDSVVAAFEAVEAGHSSGPHCDAPPGRFEERPVRRAGGGAGGGLCSVMRAGRVFEKAGVNVSEVHGELGAEARAAMSARGVPGVEEDPRFWASGVSVVAHMRNPHAPAVHMNTRMFWTPSTWWFGGGSDLNPCIEYDEDTAHFHATQKAHLDPHGTELHPKLKAWADEYFFIRHRNRPRGVGGIFMDDRNSGSWEADFALVQDIGRAFLPAFLPLVERRREMAWSEAERQIQLAHRGLYAEYNLVYDRGTRFGLATGHDADAVLMSLPPVAAWP